MADPALFYAPSTLHVRQGTVRVAGVTTNYTLHFGDGFAKAGSPNERHPYTWPAADAYTLVLVRDGERVPFITKPIRVLEGVEPHVTVEQVTDADYTVRVTFKDPAVDYAVGRFSITWVDGEPKHEFIGSNGTTVDHYYGSAGQQQVILEDHWSSRKRVYTLDLVDRVKDPDLTITEDTSDAKRMTVKLEVTHSSGAADRKLVVQWGDGNFQEISAAVGTTVSYQYAFSDEWSVFANYTDDQDAWWADEVTVPFTTRSGQ